MGYTMLIEFKKVKDTKNFNVFLHTDNFGRQHKLYVPNDVLVSDIEVKFTE
jgi:hypothetical protein